MENNNTKVLNYIYENAEMGVSTISKLLENIEDERMSKTLARQLDKYKAFLTGAELKLKVFGLEPKRAPKVSTMMSDMMIQMKTMLDDSPSKVAQMMMQGTTMGIINSTRVISENSDADQDVLQLAKNLLEFENKQFNNLRAFL